MTENTGIRTAQFKIQNRNEKMIKLIASDMDGTLLNDEKNLPPDFFEIMDRLERNHIRFVAASGRSYPALKPIFSRYCSSMNFICDNGAFIIQDDVPQFISEIAPEKVSEIVRTCHSIIPEAYLVLCGRNGIYVTDRFQVRSEKELGFYYSTRTVLSDLAAVDDTIFKIAIYDENDPKKYSFPALDKIYGSSLELVVSGHLWMDIMNKGINKGAALENIQKALGITPAETMAFGDFYNDIDLLAKADYSYVMENANEDMKKYGRFSAPDNNSYGVTRIIKQYLDKNGLM